MNATAVFRTALADWRRLLLVYLAGWPGLALVLAITWVELASQFAPGSSPDVERVAKLFSPLYLAQMPLLLWTSIFMYGKSPRQRLTDTLPLSVRELNLARVVAGALLLLAGSAPWILILVIYRAFDRAVSPALISCSALFFTCYLFASMRHVLARLVPHLLVVILWGVEIVFNPSIEFNVVGWLVGTLTPLTVLYGWLALTLPPPRWAR